MRLHKRVWFVLLTASCTNGVIEDAAPGAPRAAVQAGASASQTAQGAAPADSTAGQGKVSPGSAFANASPMASASSTLSPSGSGSGGSGSVGPSSWDPSAVNGSGESVGVGDIRRPALGPAPAHADKISGGPFVLVKNWDFGTSGTIAQMSDLIAEFQFHDQFGTIANGTNYGSVTVAPNGATTVTAKNLGLPNNRQPVEESARPYRELTGDSIKAHVRPLSSGAASITATRHDAGNGSFMAKWQLPKGGSRLQQDVLWQTRVRIPTSAPGYWFSLWAAGQKWNQGAEMDVVESFGTPAIGPGANAFHVNSVGGRDKHAFKSWISELSALGVQAADRDLTQWHVFTWVYLRDDTYHVYFDDHLVQEGTLLWTLGGTTTGDELNMSFLFDLAWGHTQVSEVNVSLPASDMPITTYELDYSRVYLRE